MFKAKLIENNTYYKSKRLLLILAIAAPLIIGLSANIIELSAVIVAAVALFGIVMIIQQYRLQKKVQQLTSQQTIEISEDRIQIKDNNSALQQDIDLQTIKRIVVKNNYHIPEETLKDLSKQLRGDYTKNYLIVEHATGEQKFEFEIDSYYMLTQLHKLIQSWDSRGIPITSLQEVQTSSV
ncbi:MAG: hypothetical protein AAF798_06995 [Bacteroidota bacterium]